MWTEEERKNNFEEGFRKEMDRQAQYNSWLKQEKEKEETRRSLGQVIPSSDKETTKWASWTLNAGILLIVIGVLIHKFFGIPEAFQNTYMAFVTCGGLFLIVLGAFPKLIVVVSLFIAVWITYRSGSTNSGFEFNAISTGHWVRIIAFIVFAIFIQKKY